MKEEIIVYRIEDPKTGEGPYTSGLNIWLRVQLASAHSSLKKTRRPCHNDFPANVFTSKNGYYFFAVSSLEKLKEWFDGFFEQLLEKGYVIAIYKTKDYIFGNEEKFGQIAFNKSTAIKIQ